MRPGIILVCLCAAIASRARAQNPPAWQQPSARFDGQVIAAIEVRGARRVPPDALRALIRAKKGDVYDDHGLHSDLMNLWNTGRFEDLRMETEPTDGGVIVRFVVAERRTVRSIQFEGIQSVTVEEIMDRFKERHVGVAVELLYYPTRVQQAAAAIQEYLAERGHPFATVATEVHEIPSHSLEVVFEVTEDPQ
jgi:outer membrane protein insertion porin family